jgi:hypothetical protein
MSQQQAEQLDQCDRCVRELPAAELWIGWDWLARVDYDAVCDKCKAELLHAE